MIDRFLIAKVIVEDDNFRTLPDPNLLQTKCVAALLKEGEWNTLRVRARGDCFEVWLNGTKTTDYINPSYPGAGPIGVQVHPGLSMSVQFKDIVVKSAYGGSGE